MAALPPSCCWLLLCVTVLLVPGLSSQTSEFPALDVVRSKVSPGDQALAVRDLIQRLIPSRAAEFDVIVDPYIGPINKDTFKLVSIGDRVQITGTSGVAAAWGLQHYLKYYCGCHVSWGGVQVSTIPSPLPKLPATGLTVTSNDRFRYYQNVCTVSYSFVWWKWDRWEQEIDWMALNAINLPLAFNGQETIFQRVYEQLGFSQADLDEFFVGPAFLAWGRMGNIEAFGGPLTPSWHKEQLALQHKILERMRSFGMMPILPAFAGHVPPATKRLFPNTTVTRLGDWGGFNGTYSGTYLLDFNDTLFQTIGKMYIEEIESEFGTDHLYSADTFNEMPPKSSVPAYVTSAGRAVYSAMATADPEAIWVMQGWLFLESFWQPPQARALLTSVAQGKMLILDLMSELEPQYVRLKSYYGQPFIWCMLHNFGGNLEMYGTMPRVNTEPFYGRTFNGSTMVGTGLTPEGIFQNDVMYEFMNENAWRTGPRDINQWVQEYSARRYGGRNPHAEKAWILLAGSVYNCTDNHNDHGRAVVNALPYVDPPLSPDLWYRVTDLRDAWSGLVNASAQFAHSDLFRYDLVDVTRESLQHVSIHLYVKIVQAYQQKNVWDLQALSDMFLGILADLDLVLASDPHFLLGLWLEAAKSWGTNDSERAQFEYNARNQITLWGPDGEIRDYASKEWAGLVGNFYYKRWSLFFEDLISTVQAGEKWNQAAFNRKVLTQIEQPFTFARDIYSTKPTGDSVKIAADLFEKYAWLLDDSFSREILEVSQANRKWEPRKLQPYLKDVVSMAQN